MDDRRLTAEASFYMAIQTVVARVQLAANEPWQSENQSTDPVLYRRSSYWHLRVCLQVTGGVSMAFRTWRWLWTGATAINAVNGVKFKAHVKSIYRPRWSRGLCIDKTLWCSAFHHHHHHQRISSRRKSYKNFRAAASIWHDVFEQKWSAAVFIIIIIIIIIITVIMIEFRVHLLHQEYRCITVS